MTTHDKKTPEEATLGAGAPGDPTRPAHDEAQRYLDVPVAYEKTDVATRPVIKVAAVLGIVSVLAVALTYGVFRLYGTLAEKGDPPAPPLARAAGRQFPEPRLQTTPVQDYRALAALGLRRVYVGLESGHDPLLDFVRKPGRSADAKTSPR